MMGALGKENASTIRVYSCTINDFLDLLHSLPNTKLVSLISRIKLLVASKYDFYILQVGNGS